MGALNQGAVGHPNAKAIEHRLILIAQGAEFEAVSGAAGIGNDCGGAGGN